ncbi:OLC1v1029930C1 [Oldenlandia corymbosa var. corymbosa]|uniref:OLC1v1029930C1 n=1 Tax=Oldenlandia corymbosa var. corymbosa TaxID=529605 RepID=A0AAV1CGX7_OLDCO|nr:OLC1v1029930C1 [Oldenlandia corymbosa var. corymbosa]
MAIESSIDLGAPVRGGAGIRRFDDSSSNGNDSISPVDVYNLNDEINPSIMLVSVQLNDYNYRNWTPGTLEYLRWKQVDSIVKSWLSAAISLDLMEGFSYASSAKQLWDDLAERYGNANGPMLLRMREELISLKHGDQPLVKHYNALKRLRDQYKHFRPLSESPPAVAKKNPLPVSSQLFGNSTYSVTSNNYSAASSITFNSNYPAASSTNDALITKAQVGKSKKTETSYEYAKRKLEKASLFCTYFQRPGHDKEGCFKIKGYPDWWSLAELSKGKLVWIQMMLYSVSTLHTLESLQLLVNADFRNHQSESSSSNHQSDCADSFPPAQSSSSSDLVPHSASTLPMHHSVDPNDVLLPPSSNSLPVVRHSTMTKTKPAWLQDYAHHINDLNPVAVISNEKFNGGNGLEIFEVGPCKDAKTMGFLIGQRFSSLIQSRLATDLILQNQLRPFSETPQGQQLIQSLSENNRKRFPDYWDELFGTAQGSGVPFLDILLLNFRKEILPFAGPKTDEELKDEISDDCSDILVVGDSMAIAAHNEDANVALLGHTYLIKGTLRNGLCFTAYTYAGELPSCAFGFNSHGLAFTLNSVPPTAAEIVAGGIARNFISRDLLEANSIDDALKRIGSSEVSVGHSYNLIDTRSRRILNVETASGSRISIHEVLETPFFHANMYLHLQVQQMHDENSISRQKRASFLPKGSKSEFLSVLGDTKHEKYPIYMTGPVLYTLCTALFDLDEKTVSITERNPKNTEPSFVFALT